MESKKGKDKPLIGWFCTYTPEEVLIAAGFRSKRIIVGDTSPKLVDAYLPSNFCPFVRSLLNLGLQGEYGELEGVVIANSCDAMRRLYDLWRFYLKPNYLHLLDVPRVVTSASLKYFKGRIIDLKESLEKSFKIQIGEEALREAIDTCNETRHLLGILCDLRRRDNPPLSGQEFWKLLRESVVTPKKIFNSKLFSILESLRDSPGVYQDNCRRIMIMGSILSSPQLIELIEAQGGMVVCEDLCLGLRYFDREVEKEGDSYEALSRRYLSKMPCARMREARERLKRVLELIKEYRVEGVIYYDLKFCDTHQYDYAFFKKEFKAQGIPLLQIEGDYTTGAIGQLQTRIEAFIEIIARKKANGS